MNQAKFLALHVFLLFSLPLFAQEEQFKQPSKESTAYHEFRMYASTPPFGLAKIKAIIKKLKYVESDGDMTGSESMDAKTYQSLSLREKFTYTMIHGESYSQVCDAYPPAQDEQKKIFGYLPDILSERNWSDRQKKFLKTNRDSVMTFIKESVSRSKRLGVNYKRAILEINGVEIIPFLIQFYNEKKNDGDVLTLINLLMRDNKYEPFLKSATYEKLYNKEYNFEAYIDYNKANEELIIKRGKEFCQSKSIK